jgi:hypothetical protein
MANSVQYVFYLGVARVANGKGFCVGNFSFNSETSIDGVKQVLEQPNFDLQQGKHYSFSVAQLAWHLIQGKEMRPLTALREDFLFIINCD